MFIIISNNDISKIIREWAKVFMHHSLRDFKHFLNESGLSYTHINILLRLLHAQTIRVSEIGQIFGMTNAAASQSIDRLVNMDLVSRTEDSEDRRVKNLELTESGKLLLERGIEARSLWMEKIIASLPPEKQKKVIEGLMVLTDAANHST